VVSRNTTDIKAGMHGSHAPALGLRHEGHERKRMTRRILDTQPASQGATEITRRFASVGDAVICL